MPQVTVGDPLAQLRAVEKKGGVEIPGIPNVVWSISPADGSVAELSPGPAPSLTGFIAKAPGTAVVTVVDAAFSLTGTLSIEVLPVPVPVPDSLEIEFTPGS